MKLLALTLVLSLTACATTPEGDDVGDVCGAIVAGIVLIPCVVAAGVGCIAGGATRCGEGAPDDDGETVNEPPPEEAAAAPAAAAMEY